MSSTVRATSSIRAGQIEAQASYDKDELLVHEIDLDMIREVRDTWQFFRDRGPETYECS